MSVAGVDTSFVWFGPASAVGVAFVTSIVTSEVATPVKPSSTVSRKVSVVTRFGAVNVGWAMFGFDKVTGVPPVCCHEYDSVWLGSGSNEPDPSSCTPVDTMTDWFGPALAVGIVLPLPITTLSLPVKPCPSLTVSVNATLLPSPGALNVGCTACESDSVTAVPAT